MAFQFGMGPSLSIANVPTAFKFSQEFVWHLSGDASGPAMGFLMQEGFGNRGMFGFTIAPKFVWDIPIDAPIPVYISPSASLGFRAEHWSGSDTWYQVDMQMGIAAKLILQDRWILWVQPTNIDMLFGGGAGARYEFLLGAGVSF
ncbi:MAG: hypothetical protein V3V08_07515 [Nannocystaceae bacterium]